MTGQSDGRLRVVQVGAGGMGRAWIGAIAASDETELVGLVDLNMTTAHDALADAGLTDVAVGTSAAEVARAVGADVVVNVTVPVAHLPVNVEALAAGYPVLCEKPAAPTVSDALRQAAAAEVHGRLLMISQSRRYFDGLRALKRQTERLGEIGAVTTDFFRAPHFGGFREEMEHVLLVDMAIHQFDAARYLIGRDPVAVYAEEYNPSWSWYRGDANAVAVFEFEGGARYTYSGSWCAPGLETSWNGRWRISGEAGSAEWDGDGAPRAEIGVGSVEQELDTAPEQIEGSLAEFVAAVRAGETPSTDARSNVASLAMVEAAVRSASTGRRVRIATVIEEAYEAALVDEKDDAVREVLERWRAEVLLPRR
ncbi:Gfo/Idh/MocA family oxidoreductase [Microbacterium sp. JZ37]|uniref:Gfo/Idh/MocA family protein n=1 Tax=Microbacterium sp. JZ37 TaxID=2654193 RepID=UPI002B487DC6|nr:Gfo/Idh/MocA family oxidoreductase [Microbacterium sp. JZ37]